MFSCGRYLLGQISLGFEFFLRPVSLFLFGWTSCSDLDVNFALFFDYLRFTFFGRFGFLGSAAVIRSSPLFAPPPFPLAAVSLMMSVTAPGPTIPLLVTFPAFVLDTVLLVLCDLLGPRLRVLLVLSSSYNRIVLGGLVSV